MFGRTNYFVIDCFDKVRSTEIGTLISKFDKTILVIRFNKTTINKYTKILSLLKYVLKIKIKATKRIELVVYFERKGLQNIARN